MKYYHINQLIVKIGDEYIVDSDNSVHRSLTSACLHIELLIDKKKKDAHIKGMHDDCGKQSKEDERSVGA